MTPLHTHHFYHLAAGFSWPGPLSEHIAAWRAAGVPGLVTVSITGIASDRAAARDWLAHRWPEARTAEHEGPAGSEASTLKLARAWAAAHPDAAILYAHAKGSYAPSAFAEAWRESLTIDVVGGWKDCLATLESDRYDAVGPHWLDPAAFPNMLIASQPNGGSRTPYFGGNFWWATAGYLAKLPVPGNRTRWDAERWIGLEHPRVLDLRKGWPSPMLLAGKRAEQMVRNGG